MTWINTGVTVAGERPKTKKALKEALATNPAAVTFDPTSMVNPMAPFSATEIPAGDVKLSVCGPDPHRKRSWYAVVENRAGKVTVT